MPEYEEELKSEEKENKNIENVEEKKSETNGENERNYGK